jgi:Lrp/AsnC family transcriptional regulator for asnA, asnC and gidA
LSVLDSTDKALIAALEVDPHRTNQALALDLSISQIEVARRLRRMDEENDMRLSAVIDIRKAGYGGMVHLHISCRKSRHPALAQAILESSIYPRLASISGIHDPSALEISARIVDQSDLRTVILPAISKISEITAYDLMVAYDVRYYRSGLMVHEGYKRKSEKELAEYITENIFSDVLDGLDICIVSELQFNGRQSLRSIARKYDISEGTVRYRLRKLVDQDVIRFKPLRSERAMGIRINAFAYIQVKPSNLEEVCRSIIAMKNVLYVAIITGQYNMRITISGKTRASIEDYWQKILRFNGVRSGNIQYIESFIYANPQWHFVMS